MSYCPAEGAEQRSAIGVRVDIYSQPGMSRRQIARCVVIALGLVALLWPQLHGWQQQHGWISPVLALCWFGLTVALFRWADREPSSG